MTSPPFIWDYLQVFQLFPVDTAFRTWYLLEKSTHLISFYSILLNTYYFLLIGRLEWATLNISCCISKSLPLLAPILYFLRAMIFASALHKLLMMTDCFLFTVWWIFSNLFGTTYCCCKCLLLTQLWNLMLTREK